MCRGLTEPVLRPRLRPGVYAAWSQGELILLDLKANRYFGLDRQASRILESLLASSSNSPEPPHTTHSDEALHCALLRQLASLNLIVFAPGAPAGDGAPFPFPAEKGGLSILEWLPDQSTRSAIRTHVRPRLVAEAVATMLRVDLLLLRKGLGGLVAKIETTSARRNASANMVSDVCRQEFIQAVERARLLYPRRTDCLTVSGALALMLLKRQINVHLVVGAQKYPFYAHCWVEENGKALNDSRDVSRRLAILLRIPRGEGNKDGSDSGCLVGRQ